MIVSPGRRAAWSAALAVRECASTPSSPSCSTRAPHRTKGDARWPISSATSPGAAASCSTTMIERGGGTLTNAAQALIDIGAAEVSAYVTHGVLYRAAVERVNCPDPQGAGDDRSIYPPERGDGRRQDLATGGSCAPADRRGEIRRIANEESVSETVRLRRAEFGCSHACSAGDYCASPLSAGDRSSVEARTRVPGGKLPNRPTLCNLPPLEAVPPRADQAAIAALACWPPVFERAPPAPAARAAARARGPRWSAR